MANITAVIRIMTQNANTRLIRVPHTMGLLAAPVGQKPLHVQ